MIAAPATAPTGPTLRDIHLPPVPGWWPPAPGWWMLAGVLLVVLVLAIWWWRRHRAGAQRRGQVLQELDHLAQRHQRDGDHAALASGVHQLLRRVARQHDPLAIQQRGEAWRRTLTRARVAPDVVQRLVALDDLIYRAPAPFDHAATLDAARQWLRRSQRPKAWRAAPTERVDA